MAIWMHALKGVFLIALALTAIVAAWGLVAFGPDATDAESWLNALLGGIVLSIGLSYLFGLGLLSCFAAWRAWHLSRTWIWVLVVLSLVAFPSPWAIPEAALTMIGAAQSLDRGRGREGET